MTARTSEAPALFSADQAARYLGVSKSYFRDHVRPFIAMVEMKPPTGKQSMPRYARVDLDAFWTARRSERRAS